MRFGALVAMLVLITTQTHAQSIEDIRKFDRNKNGRIDRGRELEVFRLHKASAIFAKYDTNFNGIIDASEAAAIARDAREASMTGQIGAKWDEVIADLGDRSGIPIEELVDNTPATEKPKKSAGPKLYVRRDKTDISVASRPIATPDAKGARISYSRDGIAKEEVWTLDAVASLVLAEGRVSDKIDPKGINLTGYALVPWLEMRRRSSTKASAPQTDKTAVGLDGEFQFFGQPLGGVQYLTFGVGYQTDRISEASILDSTVKWQPFNDSLKIGTWYTLAPNLQFTWLTALESTYRTVQKPGSYTELPVAEYWWTGGWAKALLRYRLDEKRAIVLTTQYDYRHDFYSHRIAELFGAELALPLDAEGHTSISIEYKRGRDWSTFDKFDLITTGLNFKL